MIFAFLSYIIAKKTNDGTEYIAYFQPYSNTYAEIPYLEKLISIDTRHNDAMFVLARAYYSCYDFEKAVAVYDRIIGQTKSSEIKSEAENLKRLVLEASYGK